MNFQFTKILNKKGAKEHLKNNSGEIKENQKVIASLEKLKDFLLKLNEEI